MNTKREQIELSATWNEKILLSLLTTSSATACAAHSRKHIPLGHSNWSRTVHLKCNDTFHEVIGEAMHAWQWSLTNAQMHKCGDIPWEKYHTVIRLYTASLPEGFLCTVM